MLMENYRDRKLLELYQILTGSDLKEEIKDEFVICTLYAMRCIDTGRKTYDVDRNHFIGIAKEALRIYENEILKDETYSLEGCIERLLRCMKEKDLNYRQIHRMSTFELCEMVNG